MLSDFKFHHIGMAVKDLETTSQMYVQGGYKCSTSIYDPIQNVNICWVSKEGMPTVELLAPVDEKSPVNNTLEKVGVSPYHCCYVVENLDNAISDLRKQRYVLVSRPAKAVAFRGSRVCFLYHKSIGLIELAEAPADILE